MASDPLGASSLSAVRRGVGRGVQGACHNSVPIMLLHRRRRARPAPPPPPPPPSTEPWTLDLRYARYCTNTSDGSSWKHTAQRTGAVDLAFTGWHVGYAEATDATAFAPYDWVGIIVRVWVTTTGKIVTGAVWRARRGDAAEYAAAVHEDAESARAWLVARSELGHGDAGTHAWTMACRVVGEFAGMDVELV